MLLGCHFLLGNGSHLGVERVDAHVQVSDFGISLSELLLELVDFC